MRVCFLIGNLSLSGGTERVTTLVANALLQQHQVFTLNLYDGKTPFFPLSTDIKNYALFAHKVSMKRYALQTIWRIRQFVKVHKIECLIVVDSISCVFTVPALRGLNIKHICWEHFNFNVDLGVKFRVLGRKMASRYCDTVVTLTQHDAELWKTHLPNHQAEIINISNPSPFNVQSSNPSKIDKTVVAVGRLRHEKGFDLLIEAWKKVAVKYPDWTLKIIGSGEEEEALKLSTVEYQIVDNIEFIPNTQDVLKFYKHASLYCLSSRFEGFGMVMIEAMSCGLPIVAFNCDVSPKEILKDTGNFLVEPENSDELAKALIKMIERPYQEYQQCIIDNKQQAEQYQMQNVLPHWLSLIAKS